MSRLDGMVRTPDGDLIEPVDEDLHICDLGWLGSPATGVTPCPVCRPQAAARHRARLQHDHTERTIQP